MIISAGSRYLLVKVAVVVSGLNLEELIKSLDALVQILYDDPSLSCDDLFGTDLLEAINDEKCC